ncbi:MAG: LptA/OstA family protein, partial [Limnobacter sp.]|nr:LptA/OstA family protein [Limnobacter sp.]
MTQFTRLFAPDRNRSLPASMAVKPLYAMLCLCVFGMAQPNGQAWAQSNRADKLELSIDSTLLGGEPIPDETATYVTADKLTGDGSNETTLSGNVELRRNGLTLNADELRYSPLTDRAVATGNLRLKQENLS